MNAVDVEPRAVCGHCRRPARVCYCAHLSRIETHTRVILLQHPRERYVAIGTARMASLCLPNAEIHQGVHWNDSPVIRRVLADRSRPVALLYPGEGAIDIAKNPPSEPVTLIVVDGTWAQTKKVVRENPELAALPRYAFNPPSPSEYRIRKEPHESYVSTIEALAYVLGALEGDPDRFQALLAPFRAMIDAQIECAKLTPCGRIRHPRNRLKLSSPLVPSAFRESEEDLVCVMGEANAWPYGSSERQTAYKDELVHWVARRSKTGETFDAIISPRNPLSKNTSRHIGLSDSALLGGENLSDALARWRDFVRDKDVICSWGHYATNLFVSSGGALPNTRIDLRQVARAVSKAKVGTIEEFACRLDSHKTPQMVNETARGRLRLGHAERVANWLIELARNEQSAFSLIP